MSRYNRSGFSFSRDDSFYEHSTEPSWAKDYAKALETYTTKSRTEEISMIDQINKILGNKSKYSSVEEAVQDMQARSGLKEYLEQIKQASDENAQGLFDKIPELKTYIDNYVKERPGTSVEAVVHDLLKIPMIKDHLPESDDVPEDVKKYISEKIGQTLEDMNLGNQNDLQMGKLDLDVNDDVSKDNDPFGGCNPARK